MIVVGSPAFGDSATRFTNVFVATIGILLTAPLMLFIAVAIGMTSGGPILYRQSRVGHNRRRYRGPGMENGRRSCNAGGKVFTMYKFRSMSTARGLPEAWASPDDPRITALGSLLRKHRVDELPQLFNVLRGDMNVVGPRPEQPKLFQELRAQVSDYAERQAVLPGITGWAQVNHPYDRCIDDVRRKVELDLEYIRRRSPAEDLMIIARTLPVMVWRRGSS